MMPEQSAAWRFHNPVAFPTDQQIRTINRWFIKHISEADAGCWVWRGARTGNGYGQVRLGGQSMMAHRAVFEYMVGPIPPGLDLDHLCRNRACVNPWHLDPVTRAVNLRRGNTTRTHNSDKTRCPSDHPYTQANTRLTKTGSRVCRTCERDRARRIREGRHAQN